MRPVHRADKLTTFTCRLSWNLEASTSWKPQGLSRTVMGLKHVLVQNGLLNIPLWWECTVTNCSVNILVACLLHNLELEQFHLGQDIWNYPVYVAVFIDKRTDILKEIAASMCSLGISGVSSSWTCYKHAGKKLCIVKPEEIIGFTCFIQILIWISLTCSLRNNIYGLKGRCF